MSATSNSSPEASVGIRDVARFAGVSTATVSRTLQGEVNVLPATRERVMNAVQALGYVPNAAARTLTSGRSDIIGLLLPHIANPFHSEIAQGMEDRAWELGFRCLVGSSHLDRRREKWFVDAFRSGALAGLALTSSDTASELLGSAAGRIPVVYLDRRPRGVRSGSLVATNNRESACEAVTYLIGLGHEHIAMIAGPREFQTSSQRLAGYRDAHRNAGVRVHSELISEGHLEVRGGAIGMNQLLDGNLVPTAVFAFNNLTAVGALTTLADRGYSIPSDISFVAFDDMALYPFTDPPITAIAQAPYEMGVKAADLVVRLILEPTATPSTVAISSRLIVRESCAPPRR